APAVRARSMHHRLTGPALLGTHDPGEDLAGELRLEGKRAVLFEHPVQAVGIASGRSQESDDQLGRARLNTGAVLPVIHEQSGVALIDVDPVVEHAAET